MKTLALTIALILSARPVISHGHHMTKVVAGELMTNEPIDSTLWVHILLMMLSFGIIFPTGMVLGLLQMTRNRWHVPVQIFGTIIAVSAFALGHLHKGRMFSENIHASFSNWLMLMLATQVIFGIYLRLHFSTGIHGTLRKIAVVGHGIIGKAMPVVAWVQIIFGAITSLGFCREDHLGQCLAHFIMGSAFIGYGMIMIMIMLVGQYWLQRMGRSPEFFDSSMIAAWGCVNTFTEHRWGGPWVGNDIQHTTMGVIWWCAGLAGIWLSRKRDGSPKRNFIPGFVIFLTGWAMSAHPQHLPISTMIHTVFGYTLMAAGLTRVIEVSFILRDQNTISDDGDANSFQYISPFEQMQIISDAGITHVSYVLGLYSCAFLLFLLTNILIHLYAVNSVSADSKDPRDLISGRHREKAIRQMQDAEEFELEDLMDEYDDVPESPSTLGRNNEGLVD
ncbi:hypothetical protein similar to YTP1 [Blumeria hordei DH14]|uniref:Integral membrane protein n=1 Tax=Blumeria graminis f. sp. hordei (strain DH14) TaxID=546991 RepID=N1JKE9_BLUG1|nr:hypothetical protein similar to YTP1 [Blumeria hordei DH14]